jgi:dCTP deaminase
MTLLSDREIIKAIDGGDIVVTPGDGYEQRIQPASLDVRLSNEFLRVHRRPLDYIIDPKVDSSEYFQEYTVADDDYISLRPGEFALACTMEHVTLAKSIVARLEGKSSLGRLGLMVHSTAGFIDPGFDGQVTLELKNLLPRGIIRLYPGMPIGQMAFDRLTVPSRRAYSGKYQGQRGPKASQYHRNWTGEWYGEEGTDSRV